MISILVCANTDTSDDTKATVLHIQKSYYIAYTCNSNEQLDTLSLTCK